MAIGGNPSLLILDEPTASLDRVNKIKIAELLLEINLKFGTGMLITTHDEEFLKRMGCKNYELRNGRMVEKQVENGE
jgi:ABC-type glutathione transport system ATPase component